MEEVVAHSEQEIPRTELLSQRCRYLDESAC
jgi:hypothetical protein